MTVDLSRVDRPDVLQALAEYDGLGGEAFLETYGFEPDGTHLLVHDGRSYHPHAILGVAHRYATGVGVTSEELSGGLDSAVALLEGLGFEIRPTTVPEQRDASLVGTEAARSAWAGAARPVLIEAAGRYRALVRYKQFAEAVQQASGITTTVPMHQWIGDVLARVTDECHSRDEPLLSALCVTVQGSVGEGYADAVENARGDRPSDPDEHAAHERLSCYRHWQATGLPSDGGTPLRTAHFKTVRKASASKPASRAATPRRATTGKATTGKATTRTTAKAPAPEPVPIRLCPTCFTQVPPSGVCDYCD